MTNYVYDVQDNIAHSTALAAGPWNAQHQHGSAPTSLICWAVERIPTQVPMYVARITVDLMRPVPIAPLTIHTEVVREGRKIQLCSIRLVAGDVEVVRASVLKIRSAQYELPDPASEESISLPGPDASRIPKSEPSDSNAFTTGLQMRVAKGGFRRPGPAAVWFKAERPIVKDHIISPLMRAAIAGDYCNGTSTSLDFRKWTFINGDLTISLARMPIGEWILLDAESYVGRDGAGVAFARLGDTQGYFGRAVQSLVIEPRK